MPIPNIYLRNYLGTLVTFSICLTALLPQAAVQLKIRKHHLKQEIRHQFSDGTMYFLKPGCWKQNEGTIIIFAFVQNCT